MNDSHPRMSFGAARDSGWRAVNNPSRSHGGPWCRQAHSSAVHAAQRHAALPAATGPGPPTLGAADALRRDGLQHPVGTGGARRARPQNGSLQEGPRRLRARLSPARCSAPPNKPVTAPPPAEVPPAPPAPTGGTPCSDTAAQPSSRPAATRIGSGLLQKCHPASSQRRVGMGAAAAGRNEGTGTDAAAAGEQGRGGPARGRGAGSNPAVPQGTGTCGPDLSPGPQAGCAGRRGTQRWGDAGTPNPLGTAASRAPPAPPGIEAAPGSPQGKEAAPGSPRGEAAAQLPTSPRAGQRPAALRKAPRDAAVPGPAGTPRAAPAPPRSHGTAASRHPRAAPSRAQRVSYPHSSYGGGLIALTQHGGSGVASRGRREGGARRAAPCRVRAAAGPKGSGGSRKERRRLLRSEPLGGSWDALFYVPVEFTRGKIQRCRITELRSSSLE